MGVRDSSGITPLHCSIANDNPDCCKILIDNGDNVNPVMRTKDVSFFLNIHGKILYGPRSKTC